MIDEKRLLDLIEKQQIIIERLWLNIDDTLKKEVMGEIAEIIYNEIIKVKKDD